MEPRTPLMRRSPRRHVSRRLALQALLAASGIALVRAGSAMLAPAVLAQDDDGDDDSGRGRGRGRGRGGRDDDDDEEGEAVAVTGEIPAGSIEIRIVSEDAGAFVPGELTVDLGQQVTFVNAHDDEHTATGSGFDTGVIDRGATATVTLDTAGVFPYACQFHPEMTGSISVRDASGAVPERIATPAPPGAANVTIANLAFVPARIAIAPGETVIWTNDDSAPHTVTSTDGLFDSEIFDPGATFSWTFAEPGAFSYICQLHPQMQGTVEVSGAPASSPSQTQDTASDAAPAASPQAAAAHDHAGAGGVWLLEFVADDAHPFGHRHALASFDPDGSLSVDFTSPPDAGGSGMPVSDGHGEWRAGASGVRFALSLLAVDEAGAFRGLVTMDGDLSLGADAAVLEGAFTISAAPAADPPVPAGGGSVRGVRVPLDI